jgi:YVTN family beta-propeller protein
MPRRRTAQTTFLLLAAASVLASSCSRQGAEPAHLTTLYIGQRGAPKVYGVNAFTHQVGVPRTLRVVPGRLVLSLDRLRVIGVAAEAPELFSYNTLSESPASYLELPGVASAIYQSPAHKGLHTYVVVPLPQANSLLLTIDMIAWKVTGRDLLPGVVTAFVTSPDGLIGYFVDEDTGELGAYGLLEHKVLWTTKVCGQPDALVSGPRGLTVYVACKADNAVVVVDAVNRSVVARIPVGAQPVTMLVSNALNQLVVLDAGDNSVAFVSLLTNKLLGVLYLDYTLVDMSVSSDGRSLYVVSVQPSGFAQIDIGYRVLAGSLTKLPFEPSSVVAQ